MPSEQQLLMRQRLRHVRVAHLADRNKVQAVCYNAVGNAKLRPNPPYISPLALTIACQPYAELRRGFSAAIIRTLHTLDERQMGIPNDKPSSSTGLCFGTGAFGITGGRSPQEALCATQEFRMLLNDNTGTRTDLTRFIITNMVCSTSLGFKVDLARMHAEDPDNRPYEPAVFPGLFIYWTKHYADHQAIHQGIADSLNTVSRRIELMSEDLEQFKRNNAAAAATAEAEANRKASTRPLTEAERIALEQEAALRELQSKAENFLPTKKVLVVLVFPKGNIVCLGVNDRASESEAFAYVSEVALRFKVPDEGEEIAVNADASAAAAVVMGEGETSQPGGRRKPKSQQRRAVKSKVIDEIHKQVGGKRKRGPIVPSGEAIKKISAVANTIEDPDARKKALIEVLAKEKKEKRRSKTAAAEDDEDSIGDQDIDAEIEDALAVEGEPDEEHAAEGKMAVTTTTTTVQRRVNQPTRPTSSLSAPQCKSLLSGLMDF